MQREHWHLTEGLIFAHFAVFILTGILEANQDALRLFPELVTSRPWTLVTYQFVHGTSMLWFFVAMLVLWIMARPLEESWGSPRFLVFWLISTFGASLTATAIGLPLAGSWGFDSCLLFTFATLYPDVEFRLFFIIPVKVKYLAIFSAALLIFIGLNLGLLVGLAFVAGTSAGYLFFLATRRMPTRRKIAFELKKRTADIAVKAESTRIGERNQAWDPVIRAAAERARAAGSVAPEDEPLLAELDAARDPSVTVCAPNEFGFVDDDVCRDCAGYAECAARLIRMNAGEAPEETG